MVVLDLQQLANNSVGNARPVLTVVDYAFWLLGTVAGRM